MTISQMPPGWIATEWPSASSRRSVARVASRTPMSSSSSRITGTQKTIDAPAKRASRSMRPGSPYGVSRRNFHAPNPSIAAGKMPCGPTAATRPLWPRCSSSGSSYLTANVRPHATPRARHTAAAKDAAKRFPQIFGECVARCVYATHAM